MRALDRLKHKVDDLQRRSSTASFTYGVFKKFSEDRAGQQAALLAYYGFFSLFPLMLVGVTVLGMALRGHPQLQEKVLHSALSQFPIIGDQIQHNVGTLSKSGVALVIGLVGALWAGLAGIKAMQNAMNLVWDVPIKRQPGALKQVTKATIMLPVFGTFVITSTVLSGVGASAHGVEALVRIITLPASVVLNVLVFMIAFRVLAAAELSWNDVLPGATCGGLAWTILQSVGNFYVARTLKNASAMYGFFGVVIGLLSWMYLAAQVTLLAAECNVVRKNRLWPRSFTADNLTDADRRTLARHAEVEERVPTEDVETRFGEQRRSA